MDVYAGVNLPTGWKKCLLIDFCDLNMGQSPPSSTYNEKGKGLPFYQGKSEFGAFYPKPRQFCSEPKKIANQGDILISVRAPVGPTNISPHEACIGRGLAAIKPLGAVSSRFVLYLFRNAESAISDKGTGSTFKAISKDFLEQLEFKIPPLPEQHRIVEKIDELFSELDNGIENLKKAQEQLKTYRQAVLKYAFEGKLTEEWRNRQIKAGNPPEPAEKLLERIKIEREKHYQKQLADWKKECEQAKKEGKKKPAKPKKPKELPPLTEEEIAELPELPEKWCYSYLAHLGELARGKSKHRPRNDKKLFGGLYPFIQTGEVKAANGKIKTYENTYNEKGLAQSKLWPKGTLCITIAANIANTAFLGLDACFPDSIVGFTAYESFINSKFVDYFIQATREKIESFAPATAQKNINLQTLENLLIPYCALSEQNAVVAEIESRLSICDKLEQIIEDSLQKSEALRQSILKKAFSGELTKNWREKHPELISGENSAEKLLERIKSEKEKMKATQKPKRKPTRKRKNTTP